MIDTCFIALIKTTRGSWIVKSLKRPIRRRKSFAVRLRDKASVICYYRQRCIIKMTPVSPAIVLPRRPSLLQRKIKTRALVKRASMPILAGSAAASADEEWESLGSASNYSITHGTLYDGNPIKRRLVSCRGKTIHVSSCDRSNCMLLPAKAGLMASYAFAVIAANACVRSRTRLSRRGPFPTSQ